MNKLNETLIKEQDTIRLFVEDMKNNFKILKDETFVRKEEGILEVMKVCVVI